MQKYRVNYAIFYLNEINQRITNTTVNNLYMTVEAVTEYQAREMVRSMFPNCEVYSAVRVD